jgi:hypothetical protein
VIQRLGRPLAVLLAVCLLAGGLLVAVEVTAPRPAEAWPWDSTVILGGEASCMAGQRLEALTLTVGSKSVTIPYTSAGGSATMPTPVGTYKVRIKGVPYGQPGVWVAWKVKCSGVIRSGGFAVNRPKVGQYQTRMICAYSGLCVPTSWGGKVLDFVFPEFSLLL